MKCALLITISLFIFFSSIAQTEKMTFQSLTTSMGLSHGDVLCFCQDHEGYMWIGTTEGLNKYNGIEFVVYKHNKKDTSSLPGSYINCIYEDKQNNLWIGLPDGLCRYNRDKDNFERISYRDNHHNTFRSFVNVIFEDNSKRLWIGCKLGVYLLYKEKKEFINCFEDSFDKNELNDCSSICQDKNGMLWFSLHSQNFGMIKYNTATNTITRYSTQDPIHKLKENSINCLLIDHQNNIWIGYYSSGVDMLNVQTMTMTKYQHSITNHNSLSNNNISSLVQRKDGKILIGTNGGGMNVFDPNTKLFCQYTASESDQSLLSSVVKNLYINPEGILWIACWGGGINFYDKCFNRFTLFKHKENNNSLNGNSVTCFTQDVNGNIWIATDGGGINLFNRLKMNFTRHTSDSKNHQTLTNNKVLALEKDNKGGLWAGMWQGGLNYFKIDGEKLILKKKYDVLDKSNRYSNCIFNIYCNKNNELWVGCFSTGAYKFDSRTERFKPISLASKTINYNSIRNIFCDSFNDTWFATDALGLVRLNRKSGESENFKPDEKDSTSLIKSSINVIFEDSKKRLWVGGDEEGLNVFNRITKSFTHYTTEQGLPDNSIVGILEDEHGNLWISSHNGISKASIDSINGKLKLTFRNYTVQDGLQGKVFNRLAYFKSSAGEMYFGGLNGFNTFYPDNIIDNLHIPQVHITDFLLFNKPVIVGAKNSPLKQHISQTKEILLKYDQSFFSFRFIALNYIFSEKNQYAYYMEGFDKDWNYIGNKREASYTNLNPGTYIFHVKASNNDGIWNEKGVSLQIIITPPWWETLIFRVFLIFIVLLLIFLFSYWRIASYRKKELELNNLIQQRTEELEKNNVELLRERIKIEEQTEELRMHTENLTRSNELLTQKQKLIQLQSDKLQETNQQLFVLNSTKDKFFSIIAHDLRNPFHAIIGFSELLLLDLEKYTLDKTKKYLSLIHSSSQRGNDLLENLLQWSRAETGKISFEPVALNLYAIAENTVNLLEVIAQSKNIQIVLEIETSILVNADENMLKTIFRNLISNAIKYTHEHGSIMLKARVVHPNVEISVIDNGVGIKEENIKLLFYIESNISTKGTLHESGTGLGLILCREFVEKHGGAIWVESSEGKGSEFKFTLPLLS